MLQSLHVYSHSMFTVTAKRDTNTGEDGNKINVTRLDQQTWSVKPSITATGNRRTVAITTGAEGSTHGTMVSCKEDTIS